MKVYLSLGRRSGNDYDEYATNMTNVTRCRSCKNASFPLSMQITGGYRIKFLLFFLMVFIQLAF